MTICSAWVGFAHSLVGAYSACVSGYVASIGRSAHRAVVLEVVVEVVAVIVEEEVVVAVRVDTSAARYRHWHDGCHGYGRHDRCHSFGGPLS